MNKHYIKAVLEMIRTGKSPDEIFTGLSKVLKEKGHERLKASVLSGVLRILEAESDRTSTTITVAKSEDISRYESAIAEALKKLAVSNDYKVLEDKSVIGGFIANANNQVYDASYKTKLVNLYRNITT
jgi:F0F1-type ATP synthase delta subunit